MSRLILAENVTRLGTEDGLLSAQSVVDLALWEIRPSAIVTVQAPDGTFYRGELRADCCHIRLFHPLPADLEPPFPRRLCQAIPDKQRMFWIIQKAVELGVTAIQPMMTDRANAFPAGGVGEQLLRTWRRVALQSAKQCRRATLPTVLPPTTLALYLATPLPDSVQRLWADTGVEDRTWHHWSAVDLLIGPEGGWSEQERAQFRPGCRPLLAGAHVRIRPRPPLSRP